ncbi:uncharacterized protein TNCT_255411 [Trichonephila clavata]|uniref:Uncharacterized protein n=1 Tax=Trichonephila clavata TaxID=2740835 RepID=A0A8X6FX29_TRICU|nr:uncharacterized protein TNCT_255411 [Trichonephila clavata]
MIDITAGGENMESHFEQAHASHSEPVKVNFIPMPDLPESSSDSDNEYSKLQGRKNEEQDHSRRFSEFSSFETV